MRGGSRNICARFSCWWVDYKLWVLLVVWGDQIRLSVVSDSRRAGLETIFFGSYA